jgi:hypothetical protein
MVTYGHIGPGLVMCYAGSMFDQGPPKTPTPPPAPGFVRALPPLQAPVWERQSWETEAEHAAFMAYLTRGKHVGDMSVAVQYSGLAPEQVRSASLRCVWELRAREWHAHTREAQREAARPLREAVHAVMATRLRVTEKALALIEAELDKHTTTSKGTPMVTQELRNLRSWYAAISPALVDMRRQAEGLPAELAADDGPDYSALSAEELEILRRLRAKAKAG